MTAPLKQTVRQETFEQAMMAIANLVHSANDLESIGDTTDARELREIVGKIDSFITDMRLRHS